MKRATPLAGLLLTLFLPVGAPAHPAEGEGHQETQAVAANHSPAAVDLHADPAASSAHAEPSFNLDPRAAMARLLDGNDRFRYGESSFPRFDPSRRSETFSNGQQPFAAVLSCADSRVPVEAVFDQGIGDLFVVRVAGNVAGTNEMGTIEYGVGHLGTGLIVVLGHSKCGAVTAVADGAGVQGHIAKLVDNITPAVDAVKANHPDVRGARMIRLAIRANVHQSMQDLLSKSDLVAAAVKRGKVQVVGGVYDLQTGAIEWLGEHPKQAEILAMARVDHGSAPETSGSKLQAQPGRAKPTAGTHPGANPAPGASAKPADKQSKSSAKPRKENWLALGGLLGISAAGSFATIQLMYGRK